MTLKKEDPSLSMTQMTTKMSEEWKGLDEKKRKKYEDLAAKDKERYEKEVEAAGGSSNAAAKKKKKEAEEGAPKRPLSAYFVYLEDRREAIKKEKPGLEHKEYLKLMGQEWQNMDAKKKEKYEAKAKQCKEKYDVEKK